MTVKLLTERDLEFLSLTGGHTGSSESIHIKMPHCWKSRVMAHLVFVTCAQKSPINAHADLTNAAIGRNRAATTLIPNNVAF